MAVSGLTPRPLYPGKWALCIIKQQAVRTALREFVIRSLCICTFASYWIVRIISISDFQVQVILWISQLAAIYSTLAVYWILTFTNTTRTGSTVTSHMSVSCSVYYLGLPSSCLDAAGGETVICERGNGHLYTISFSVAAVADILYHVTVAVESDTGIVP